MNNTDEINVFSGATSGDDTTPAAFDTYTDETEEEKQLHARRRERIAKMKKRKARQVFMRTHSKMIAVLSGVLSLCIIIAVAALVYVHKSGRGNIFAKTNDGIESADNSASSDDPDMTDDDAQTQEDTDPGSKETDTEDDNP